MKHKLLLGLIIAISIFLRTYRTSDFLGFWYDQGRDAQVIWQLLHSGKFFLIGPTTGIEGIFLGPFFYYLLTPFYLLGSGNPVYPAVALALTNILALFVIYKIGRDFFSPSTGLLAAALFGFSYRLGIYHRWLANPTPLPLFAVSVIYILLRIINSRSKIWEWPCLGLLLGLSLQLEAASAVFFIPATIIILFLNRKSHSKKTINYFFALLLFFITLLPQLIFNFRHENILFHSFYNFLFSQKSFQPVITNFFTTRLNFYFQSITDKFYFTILSRQIFFIATALMSIMLLVKKLIPNHSFLLLSIWWLTPLIFLMFYHGNNGYVWDYYFTGVFPALILLIAVAWTYSFQHFNILRPAVVILFSFFVYQNFDAYYWFFKKVYPPYITLTPMLQAVDWVYSDAAGIPFNTDTYVPPAIPYAYDYLYAWRATVLHQSPPTSQLVSRLYTIAEPDGDHPHYLEKWSTRQSEVSTVQEEKTFGSLTVARRLRFKYE